DALAFDFEDRGDPSCLLAVLREVARRRGALRGLLRLSRGLAPLLPGGLARIDVGAKAAIRRMPEGAVASDLGVLDLADELGEAPPRRLIRTRLRSERRRRRLVLLQDLQRSRSVRSSKPVPTCPTGCRDRK